MKNQVLILLIVLSFMSLSCDKDGEDNNSENRTGTNSMDWKGTTTQLTKAYIDRIENRESESAFIIVLLSDEASVEFKGDGHIDYIKSNGAGIWAELNSQNGSDITTGEYFYDPDATVAFTFDYADGGATIDGEFTVFTTRDGKITVSENGNSYDLAFDFETNLGEKVTGRYSGEVTKIDF